MSRVHARVIELHDRGRRPADIAHDLGVAIATVQYHLRTREPDRGTGECSRPQASAPTREMVAALLARGISRVEISRRLGVAKSTVSYHARSLGAPVDARCAKRIDWDLVQRYYDDGYSVRECVQRFGFSTSSWHQAVKRGQIRPRPAAAPLAPSVRLADDEARGRDRCQYLRGVRRVERATRRDPAAGPVDQADCTRVASLDRRDLCLGRRGGIRGNSSTS
jgi:DNA-binding CsgD family transcriptional regulator